MKIKLLSQDFLDKKEDQFYKWFWENRFKVLSFGAVSFLLHGMASVPYVNLFLSRTILASIALYFFLSLFLGRVRWLVIVGSILLLLSFPMTLIKENLLNILLGDFVFGIFFLAVIYKIFEKN